ncbi:MAG TPA: biosynthetic peptidoglycan transglycosylase [Vicinamibacterales bacterium]|nr:biosynthetic peptidoglycan transglycosylase [Vicinamibacterales bacterium]
MITLMRTRVMAMSICVAAVGIAVEPVLGLPAGDELRAQVVARYPREAIRSWKPLWFLAPTLTAAVVSWEDPAFYHHGGLSYPDMFEALKENLRQGRFARGGSTITQQVAKNLFLTRDKTLRRKLQDAVLARRLEKVLSKDEILEVYLNIAEWGPHVYGAEAAARFYFDVSANQLDWSQAALLVAMLPNPHLFSPCAPGADAEQRRNHVLEILFLNGTITSSEHERAAASPILVSCAQTPARRGLTAGLTTPS